MIKRMVCSVAITVAIGLSAIAQDMQPWGERAGRERPRRGDSEKLHSRGDRGMARNAWFGKVLRNPEFAARIGLTEEQQATIDKALAELGDKHTRLRQQMEAAALKQARLMMAEDLDEEALMSAVEETGHLRTEQAKLRIKHLLVMRKTLTPEQTTAVRKFMQERERRRSNDDGKPGAGDQPRGQRRMHGGGARDRGRPNADQ